MTVPTNEQMVALEQLVDQHTLREIVIALGIICGDKSDHIRASYDDKITAHVWMLQHDKLMRWSEMIPV